MNSAFLNVNLEFSLSTLCIITYGNTSFGSFSTVTYIIFPTILTSSVSCSLDASNATCPFKLSFVIYTVFTVEFSLYPAGASVSSISICIFPTPFRPFKTAFPSFVYIFLTFETVPFVTVTLKSAV